EADRYAAPMEDGQRMPCARRVDPCLDIARRREVEADVAGDQFLAERRIVDGAGSVCDPPRVHLERPTNLRGAAPLAGVDRDREPLGACDVERTSMEEGIGEGLFRPGQIERGQAAILESCGDTGQHLVVRRRMRSEGSRDQAYDGPG